MSLHSHHPKQAILRGLAILVTSFCMFCGIAQANTDQVNTSLSLRLYNTFSGTHTLLNTWCYNNGLYYVGSDTFQVSLTSQATGSYLIDGDVQDVVTGAGIWAWALVTTGLIQLGDGTKNLRTTFFKDTEWYRPENLFYELDLTPPLAPIVKQPWIFNYNGKYIYFRRDGSPRVDTGAWFTDYLLHISNSPDFSQEVVFVTEQQYLMVANNILPFQGTDLYWYVGSRDCVNNERPSIVWRIDLVDDEDQDEDENTGNWEGASPSGSWPWAGSHSSSDPDNIYRPDAYPSNQDDTPDDSFLDLFIPKYAAKRLHDAPWPWMWIIEFPYPLDTVTVFVLPEKLQNTGAPRNYLRPVDPLPAVYALIKHLPDTFDKAYLYAFVDWFIHIRYLGAMMLFWVLAYDIQTVGARYFQFFYKI